LVAFLLAVQVAQQCLVNPEKSALTFSTESLVAWTFSLADAGQSTVGKPEVETRLLGVIADFADK